MDDSCFTCRQERTIADGSASVPSSEQIHVDELWRVAHAIKVALRGWLVVMPRRHVTSVAELTAAEAAAGAERGRRGPRRQTHRSARGQLIAISTAWPVAAARR